MPREMVSLASVSSELTHSRQWWATKIAERWQDSAQAIIDIGRMLMEAKKELPHGEFGAMCGEGLPFSRQTAFRLMSVARDSRLSNVAHGQHLPNSWRTLYELTKLDDEAWDYAFESGAIHPGMERKDVTFLANEFRRDAAIKRNSENAEEVKTCTFTELETLIGRGFSFGTIYADPPWTYCNQGTRAATGNHYVGMTVDEIAALPIRNLAAEDSHLHLWTTNAFLFDCKDILNEWGFSYKSCFVWTKPQMGIGNYWRVSHEFMLLGIKGSCPFLDRSQKSHINQEREKHSSKPEIIREIVEKVSPKPRLELFARKSSPGWVSWGNEIELSIFDTDVEVLT